MNTETKHIHIVGICGVATSALAIAFKKKGWKVTGSDKGFYPPVSTELEKNEVEFYAGWHPEKMDKPDVVMMGGSGTSPSNPEIMYAKENNIPLISFAEALGTYAIQKNSIVAAGTWGKTTSSSLLSFILIQAGMDPSYFSGGVSLSHASAAITDSDWSVVEGDEYQTSISDKKPKFAYYKPTHLLLTSVSWDHADLYPTEAEYFLAFEKLVKGIPERGLIVACIDDNGVRKVLEATGRKAVSYGIAENADYSCRDVKHSRGGLAFSIHHGGEAYHVKSSMLGRFNAENITACFAMAHQIGIKPEVITKAIDDFKGIKRRFERRLEGEVTVLDCHAPTAEKAAAILHSMREVYDKKIIAIYEPNIGGRQRASMRAYDNAFADTDLVIIPRLTKLKVSEDAANVAMEGDELANVIAETQKNVSYVDDDATLVDVAISQAKKGDVIVFLGSHGFRGMIEEVVRKLS